MSMSQNSWPRGTGSGCRPGVCAGLLARAGLRNRHARKSTRQRRSRDRMPQEGLLVQCDARPYAWLEKRGPSCALHGAIDDATGKVLGLYFRPEEDLVGHLMVLKQMVERHDVHRRKLRGCTRRNQEHQSQANLGQRDFAPPRRNQPWVADLTRHGTAEGWLYLATVLDALSRRVVGWGVLEPTLSVGD